MKDKDPTPISLDRVDGIQQASMDNKEILDDSCFKAPLLLPPRKAVSRRRNSVVRNGQNANADLLSSRSRVCAWPAKSKPGDLPLVSSLPNSNSISLESTCCSCSSTYLSSFFSDDICPPVVEAVIDQFSLLLLKNSSDLRIVQSRINETKTKEETENKKRNCDEFIRPPKKKGRRPKIEIEKEKKAEIKRLRREEKEQRRKERRERREREGDGIDIKLRKKEKQDKKEMNMEGGENLKGEIEKKDKKLRKPRDPNAPKKDSSQRRPKLNIAVKGNVVTESAKEAATSEGCVDACWMSELNDSTFSPIQSHSAKRSSELVNDPVTVNSDKRLKLDPSLNDIKNGLIGIAVKSDYSTVVCASPPVVSQVTSRGVCSLADNAATSPFSAPWSTKLSQQRSVATETKPSTSSASIENTHPVDPGHDLPSTSNTSAVPSCASGNTIPSANGCLFVNTALPSVSSSSVDAPCNRDLMAANDSNVLHQSTLLDPLRQVLLNNPNFAVPINAAAAAGSSVFGNPFIASATPASAAAAAFPFLAAQMLQHQQTHQPISINQTVSQPSTVVITQTPVSSSSGTALQFPPGAALGSQLAGAALLGRALPAAAPSLQSLNPMKVKQGKWCSMHVKIAYEISARKERRATPQPVNPIVSQSTTTIRNGSTLAPPLCLPSTSNAQLTNLPSGFSGSLVAMAAASGLQSPFSPLQFQQFPDSKLVHQSATAKSQGNRSAGLLNRNPSGPGMHMSLNGGLTGPLTAGNTLASVTGGPLSGSMSNLGSSILPLTSNLSASGSISSGTSDAAAQNAMIAALAQSAQQNNSLTANQIQSNPFLLTAQPQHPPPVVATSAQQQLTYPSHRLFDNGVNAVLQQMQSMEAIRQSAAAAQLAPSQVAAAAGNTGLDLLRFQMEQQMMERYVAALSASSQSAPNFDLMRQQLLAAQIRQHQQQQPTLETLLEIQRQQQQQQLLNASRNLPAAYNLPGVTPSAGMPPCSLPQGLSNNLFNASHLMSLGGAAVTLQQSLYNKNPYSNSLEQLARQKRDSEMSQVGR